MSSQDSSSASSASSSPQTALTLPAFFSEGMVLQRDKPIRLWGHAGANESVSATLAGFSSSAVADQNGNWVLFLPAIAAGGPHNLVLQSHQTVTLTDVMVGDVWIAGGQSNMELPLNTPITAITPSGVAGAADEINAANYPNLRFFRLPYHFATTPQTDVLPTTWMRGVSTELSDKRFSAVAWFFAKRNHLDKNVPVGIIDTSMYATNATEWVSLQRLLGLPAYQVAAQDVLTRQSYWDAYLVTNPNPKDINATIPGLLYNGMIAPIAGYTTRGFIWYQGEANVGDYANYYGLFTTLIDDWRGRWSMLNNSSEVLPFLYVQLASYDPNNSHPAMPPAINQPANSSWALLRNVQKQALAIPNTGMAVAIDLGDPNNVHNVHPPAKKEVGERLWLNARHWSFNESSIVFSGPLVSGVTFRSQDAVVSFSYVGSGLTFQGTNLIGFELAGANGVFYNATASIVGDQVVVSVPGLSNPTKIRYGWSDYAVCNLYNSANLPAVPFQWPDN